MSVVLTGAEAVVHGLLDVLKASLNDKLQEMSDEYPLEDPLPPVVDEAFFDGDIGFADISPSIQVLVARTEQIDVYNPRFDALYTLVVIATLAHHDQRVLTRWAYRYARAITRAIAGTPELGGTVTRIAEVRHDFSALLQVTGGYAKDVNVEVIVQRRETGV